MLVHNLLICPIVNLSVFSNKHMWNTQQCSKEIVTKSKLGWFKWSISRGKFHCFASNHIALKSSSTHQGGNGSPSLSPWVPNFSSVVTLNMLIPTNMRQVFHTVQQEPIQLMKEKCPRCYGSSQSPPDKSFFKRMAAPYCNCLCSA